MPKLCGHLNCRKRATFGYCRRNGEFCKEHKKDDMKCVSHLCICGKAQPIYNEPGQTVAICCSQCKTDNMVNVRNKKCQCGKAHPVFNEPDQTVPICCSKCKTDNMVNVISKKCICGKATAIYNEPGQTRAICCSQCKTRTMVNVISKKCRCGKVIPTYNEPGQTVAICCSQCKTQTMVDVRNNKCRCGKAIPTFNEPGQTVAICCSQCKTQTMVDVNHKKCQCGKAIPYFNEPGQTRAICCSQCKTDTMVDVKNPKCKGVQCKDPDTNEMITKCPFEQHGNPKYKGYCTQCFSRNFPSDPLTYMIRSKTKEIAVRNFINDNFEGFQHDKTLFTGHCDCSIRRRIDHRKLIGNTLLVIETDENQHKSYDKMDEETRYDDLYMAFSGKWVYIRFNPDKYKASNGKNKNPNIATRLFALKDEINKQINRIENDENNGLVERIYLYYDGYK